MSGIELSFVMCKKKQSENLLLLMIEAMLKRCIILYMWYTDVDNSRIENVCKQQLGACGASLILLSRPLLSNSIGAGGYYTSGDCQTKPHHSRLSQACQHGQGLWVELIWALWNQVCCDGSRMPYSTGKCGGLCYNTCCMQLRQTHAWAIFSPSVHPGKHSTQSRQSCFDLMGIGTRSAVHVSRWQCV